MRPPSRTYAFAVQMTTTTAAAMTLNTKPAEGWMAFMPYSLPKRS